jgi:hypothetical protein
LTKLGLPLFDDSGPPNEIAPAHLADSKLQRIGAFLADVDDANGQLTEVCAVAERATARVRASKVSYAVRKAQFAGLEDVVSLVRELAPAAGTPPWQLEDALDALARSIEAVREHELARIDECIAWERQLEDCLESGDSVDRLSVPKEPFESLIANEPRPASLLRPIVEFFDRHGIWDRLSAYQPLR